MPSVTAKIINPDRRSDYKNYLIRDVHSNDVQTLNGLKALLKEELGERVPKGFDFDVGFYRGNKQVWMRSDSDVKEFLSILKEKPECVLWCMGKSTKKRSRDQRPSSEESDAGLEIARKSKTVQHYQNRHHEWYIYRRVRATSAIRYLSSLPVPATPQQQEHEGPGPSRSTSSARTGKLAFANRCEIVVLLLSLSFSVPPEDKSSQSEGPGPQTG